MRVSLWAVIRTLTFTLSEVGNVGKFCCCLLCNSFIDIYFNDAVVPTHSLKVYTSMNLVFTQLYTRPTINSRMFYYPEKNPQQSLLVFFCPYLPSPASVGKHQSAFCLYGFAYPGHFTEMESQSTWSLVTATFTWGNVSKLIPCCCLYQHFII